MKLNFIQDIASPHNNVIGQALEDDKDIELNLWFCQNQAAMYGWKEDLTNAVKPAKMYQRKWPDFKFLWHCITKKDEKYFIVGWQNTNTRLLMILFCLLRRPYAVWFDCPDDNQPRGFLKNALREFFYTVLKLSKAHVFGVGQMTVDYFKSRGFTEKRLSSLPIFTDISQTEKDFSDKKETVFKKYNVKKGDLFLSAGSRLIYEKGYDILIDAIHQLPSEIKAKTKCVIVGKGDELETLQNMIEKYKLQDNIVMEEWLEFDDFKALIAHSDVFIHPSRYDAFGGTIFAHTLSTPVLGSVGAGAAYDRIVSGENGYLYKNDDPYELAKLIEKCAVEKDSLKIMGNNGRKTAEKWSPEAGVSMIAEGFETI